MALPSGFENYLSFEHSSPSNALSMAYSHRAAVLTAWTAAVASGATSYNPAPLQALCAMVDKDIRRLSAYVNRDYLPYLQPCIRIDPLGTNNGQTA